MHAETLALTRDLVTRRSLTPADAGCQALLAERLAASGFVAEWLNRNGVTNGWLRRGTAAPLVCLAGHTDVVPTGPEWDWHGDPFVPLEKNGKLYGRGVADMKASVAAMTVACERLVREFPGHRGSLALLLTSDEEGPATDGTVAVVEALKARGTQIDYCLIGEPSSSVRLGDTLKNGRRGSLSAHLVVKGVQGHVAYPEEVRNPIHLAAPALAELAATVWDAGNASFPPTSFQISNIKGGTGALNVVPGAVAIDFNFRFCTASTEAGLRARTCAILDRHGLDYSIDWVLGAKPFLTEEGRLVDAVQGAIHEITGQRAAVLTTGGTSDGRFICEICPELVEFGPVNRSIHKVNEFVELDCLGPLAEVYFRTLTRLLVD